MGDTANVSDTLDLQPGQVFAGWRIERELARGGMGVLYLAHHPRLPRTDVIKVLSPMLSTDQRFRERFLREVTRMSTLSHPHLMTIHDSGESDNGTLYLVMPFISGGDLRALLKNGGPLPPGRAARIITQLGAALDAAHRVGVVHRDVKPENVLLASVEPDDTDHAVLTDFGISREDMASNTLTATGELLLTPAYASPEQVLGQVVDARADQYALACILYELLTGEPPYRNDVQVVMLMAHVQEPIPRIGGRFGLPRAIDDVIARGMAKSATERFRTAGRWPRPRRRRSASPPTCSAHRRRGRPCWRRHHNSPRRRGKVRLPPDPRATRPGRHSNSRSISNHSNSNSSSRSISRRRSTSPRSTSPRSLNTSSTSPRIRAQRRLGRAATRASHRRRPRSFREGLPSSRSTPSATC